MDIDNLCSQFNETVIEYKPSQLFVQDINSFLEELKNYENILEADVYEILVACGSNINWSLDAFITLDDLYWFKTKGKTEFYKYIHENIVNIDNIYLYEKTSSMFDQLCEIFELAIGGN